jgi:hypothetical protein
VNPSWWVLQNVSASTSNTFAGWLIDQDSISKVDRSLAIGSLAFRQHKSLTSTLDFAVGQTVRATRGGVGWFYGRVQRATPGGAGDSEFIDYEISSPWWWLENLIFQEDWNIATDPTNPNSALVAAARGRIIAGLATDGSHVLTGAVCTAVAQYAIARGAPFTVGGTFTGIEIPSMEFIDMSCAEILRALIRWTPDVAVAWDYSPATPRIMFKRRGAQTAKSRSIVGPPGAGTAITARNDLLVPGVVLKFERVNSLNEKSWRTISTQQAGADTFGTLVLTIELGGSQTTFARQDIITTPIDANLRTWWITKFPWLANATGTDGTGFPSVTGGAVDPAATEELTDGATPPWLAAQSFAATVTAQISFKHIQSDNGTEVVKRDHLFTVKVTGTTLTTGTYTRLLSSSPEESIPSNVAAGIYAALNVLHYEGNFQTIEEEISGAFAPGDTLNLTGGRAEWSSMAAQIQEVSETPANGQMSLRFGPPAQLGPQDFIELARMNRNRRPGWRVQERLDGIAQSGGGTSEGPRRPANDVPAPLDTGESEKVIAQKTGANVKKIALRISDILAAYGTTAEIKLREFDICEAGVAKKILILASNSRTP